MSNEVTMMVTRQPRGTKAQSNPSYFWLHFALCFIGIGINYEQLLCLF